MEFARQEYLWLLLVIPLVILLWGIGLWHQRRMRLRFGTIRNLQSSVRISWAGKQWCRGSLFVAALALMALGLACPRAIVRELHAVPTPTDLVFLLDTSPSMYARDMDPSRLGRAERIIQRFIYLKQDQDHYGLIAFNWTSVVLSYMTSDPQNILLYFDSLNQEETPQPGTNVGSVLTNAMRLVATEQQGDPEGARRRRVVFLLLSDGDDKAKDVEKPLAEVIKSGIKIYAIGLGSATGSYVPLEMAGGLKRQASRAPPRRGGPGLLPRARREATPEPAQTDCRPVFR